MVRERNAGNHRHGDHRRCRHTPQSELRVVDVGHWLRAERALVLGRLMFGLAPNTPLTDTVVPLSALKQRHYLSLAAERLKESRGY